MGSLGLSVLAPVLRPTQLSLRRRTNGDGMRPYIQKKTVQVKNRGLPSEERSLPENMREERRWVVRWRDLDGKECQKTFYKEVPAKNYRSKIEMDLASGSYVGAKDAETPFREVVEIWQRGLADKSPKTRTGYESALTKHVLPRFGARRVGTITERDVQEFVEDLRLRLQPRSVRNVYAVLRSIMKVAVRERMIAATPCGEAAGIALPKPAHDERPILTPTEVLALVEAIDPHYRLLVLTAARTGMRAGELAGLRRKAVDPLRGTISITETVREVSSKEGSRVEGTPKTRRSRRTIAIDPELRRMFSDLFSGDARFADANAYVFVPKRGDGNGPARGPLSHSAFYRRHFKPAVQRTLAPSKQSLRFHDLRHTAASILIAQGVQPFLIQRQLGHSSINVTFDLYGHLMPDNEETAAKAMERAFALPAPETKKVRDFKPSH